MRSPALVMALAVGLTSGARPASGTPTAPAALPPAGERVTEGAPLPPFALPVLNPGAGRATFDTRDTAGAPLVLSFVASHCGPCKREVPALLAALAGHPEVRVALVVVDREEDGREAERRWLVEELAVAVPVLADRFGLVGRRYGVDELPMVVVAGPDGATRLVARGFHPDSVARVVAALGLSPAPPPVPTPEPAAPGRRSRP